MADLFARPASEEFKADHRLAGSTGLWTSGMFVAQPGTFDPVMTIQGKAMETPMISLARSWDPNWETSASRITAENGPPNSSEVMAD